MIRTVLFLVMVLFVFSNARADSCHGDCSLDTTAVGIGYGEGGAAYSGSASFSKGGSATGGSVNALNAACAPGFFGPQCASAIDSHNHTNIDVGSEINVNPDIEVEGAHQKQKQYQGQTSVGLVKTNYNYSDNSVYEIAAAMAASLPAVACPIGNSSASWQNFGFSLAGADEDPVCARMRLIAAELQLGVGYQTLGHGQERLLTMFEQQGGRSKGKTVSSGQALVISAVAGAVNQLDGEAKQALERAKGDIDDVRAMLRGRTKLVGRMARIPVLGWLFVPFVRPDYN